MVIDVQRDFLDGGASPVAGTSGVVPNVAALVSAFRVAGRPIAHVVRLYQPGGTDVDLPRRAMIQAGARIVAPGSEGSEIPESILPTRLDAQALLNGDVQPVGPGEVVFFKPRWSAFYRTSLESWLHANGCDTVLVVGCNLPNCPRATLFDASERDFRTVLAYDAVSQCTPERLADLASIGVQITDTTSIVSLLVTSP
ncbi:cysteine hydrolase family protein [Microbacterium resistens]|uniref:cysteine hydrolase family protein n=1 Tax=Microbacterium resistens TaxID=156977 RepID=UPI001C57ECBC|nr:isochorismatase family cysteine hydrolase [Microbacterium resistens]